MPKTRSVSSRRRSRDLASAFRFGIEEEYFLVDAETAEKARLRTTLASLTQYLSAGVAGHWLPPLRAALLGPGPRDRWYSANMSYTRALCTAVLPAITGRVATSVRVGMGTSLGALSATGIIVRRAAARIS